jgi:hypothetical protein
VSTPSQTTPLPSCRHKLTPYLAALGVDCSSFKILTQSNRLEEGLHRGTPLTLAMALIFSDSKFSGTRPRSSCITVNATKEQLMRYSGISLNGLLIIEVSFKLGQKVILS